MSFRAIESLRFQIIEFLIFWGLDFGGVGVQKKLPAQSLREKRKNHSYKLFGAELHDQHNSTNSN